MIRVIVEEIELPKDLEEEIKKCGEWVLEKIGRNKKVNVFITNDKRIREMNYQFRKINQPTDVLSFPYHEKNLWGEIVISLERIRENALKYNVEEREELLRVLIHGILHLKGERDYSREERRRMFSKQEELLKEYKRIKEVGEEVERIG
ncbi:rRNA maturation RNase YbeY [Candidatus Calescamantes bacterium]|nr:rRNA maturation RNase YbeY [Candidatus Calescamantes bacterium]